MERTSALPPNRSISLPSTLHPTSLCVEAELNKLRAWETRSCSSSETLTAETVQTGLVGLSEVYRCAEELVYSSLTQNGKALENALDHSLKLLDTCGVVRETQQKLKEQALCLQSSFRRRGTESRFEDEISSYLRLRKKLKKEASKCIRSLKGSERKFTVVVSFKDYHLAMVVKVLRDVNVKTSRVLRFLLMFLSSPGTTNKKRRGGCSLIRKLRPTEKGEKIANEVGSVDGALLCVLHGTEEMTMANRKLESLVISLDSIEAGLDVLFRRLIRYRVSILNVLTR
ncbi:hypothetical protein L1987_05698 [Smallanthus sonchifolius]|uniref:Uncharacterized protein n=1 Tax=Smallanthus sonchifolius TaxID=185202 RepID=A0ACB9JW52_9ASTR|nr:hypothetical protein L1987_05698 [Smallanthus sonchifolius]